MSNVNKIPKKTIILHDICKKNSKIPITNPGYSKYIFQKVCWTFIRTVQYTILKCIIQLMSYKIA